MPNFGLLAPTEAEIVIGPPEWGSNDPPGGQRGSGQLEKKVEIICTSIMPKFSFAAPTETEIAI